MQRRVFTEEFKRDAVRLANDGLCPGCRFPVSAFIRPAHLLWSSLL